MNKSESKYFNTAEKMDEALFSLIEKKDLEFITVKEICEKAGVNRSTFYLHYETIGDLIEECTQYLNRRFERSFEGVNKTVSSSICDSSLKDLIFITPEYLLPYLNFVKENYRFFQTSVLHSRLFGSVKKAKVLEQEIFAPILRRFDYSESMHKYVLLYYLNGIMAIITEWIRSGLEESPKEIADIVMQCVVPNEDKE